MEAIGPRVYLVGVILSAYIQKYGEYPPSGKDIMLVKAVALADKTIEIMSKG